MDNPDPLCLLNLGAGGMTLTKIKDAFAIFKNLTLESRHALAKGGGLLTDGRLDGVSVGRCDLLYYTLWRVVVMGNASI